MSIIEDWYSLNGGDDVGSGDDDGKKVEELQRKLESFSVEIQELKGTIAQLVEELRAQQASQTKLLEEIKHLRASSTESEHLKQTRDLLEELKVMKQRELNLLLREKIPVPFFASTETVLTKKILL